MKTNVLLTGDCYDVLPTIPDESVDLILTSPPYSEARKDAYTSVVRIPELGEQFERILKLGGVLCWNIGDPVEKGRKTIVSYRCVVHWCDVQEKPLYLHDHIALLKDPMPGKSSQRSRPGWEHMYVFKKGKGKITFNDKHLRVRFQNSAKKAATSCIRQKDGSLSTFTRSQSADLWGKDPGNYLYYPLGSQHTTQDPEAYEHPALMGESIAEDFILSYTNPGMVVLDPFSGAGTTAKMAYINQREYVGIELEQEFNDIAQVRIDRAVQKVIEEPKPMYTEEDLFGDAEFNQIFEEKQ